VVVIMVDLIDRFCWSWPSWCHMTTPLWMTCSANWLLSSCQWQKHNSVLFSSQMTAQW